jgi:hypothetical protein
MLGDLVVFPFSCIYYWLVYFVLGSSEPFVPPPLSIFLQQELFRYFPLFMELSGPPVDPAMTHFNLGHIFTPCFFAADFGVLFLTDLPSVLFSFQS